MYGFVANVSISKLFMAGIIPGLLIAFFLTLTLFIITKKYEYPKEFDNFSVKKVFSCFMESIFVLLIPLIVIGGIKFGFMTPTEAGALVVVYVFLLGRLIYKKLSYRQIKEVLVQSSVLTSIIMLIIMVSVSFGWVLSWEQIPQQFAKVILGISNDPVIVLIIINIFLLIVGMFLGALESIVLLTPLFLPLISSIGIDPVQFGIIMVLNLVIGGITPPMGVVMFTTLSATESSLVDFIKSVWPFYLALLLVLSIVTFFPKLSLLFV